MGARTLETQKRRMVLGAGSLEKKITIYKKRTPRIDMQGDLVYGSD
jgi:hypothetical protein